MFSKFCSSFKAWNGPSREYINETLLRSIEWENVRYKYTKSLKFGTNPNGSNINSLTFAMNSVRLCIEREWFFIIYTEHFSTLRISKGSVSVFVGKIILGFEATAEPKKGSLSNLFFFTV
jgi:hypothetical protein